MTARVVARLSVAPSAVGAGGVWVTCCDDGRDGRGRLARVDPDVLG